MPIAPTSSGGFRFGPFEFDRATGELRKGGTKIRLNRQAVQVLTALLENAGHLITREELRSNLWPEGTFVDFDHSLNAAVNRLRQRLGDSAENCCYIETIPGRGYRFIAPVTTIPSPEAPIEAVLEPEPVRRPRFHRFAIAISLGLLLTFSVLVDSYGRRPAPIRSLALLPFDNISRDADQEYFVDGMSEALITELGRTPDLRVVSNSSTIGYKGSRKPLSTISKELGVDYVVQGAVARSGTRLRVTVRLVDPPTGRLIWSEAYEREMGDVLLLQDEISRAVAGELKSRVQPEVEPSLQAKKRTLKPEAVEAYLKAKHFQNKMTEEGLNKSIEYFQQAIAIEPDYAIAYAGLSDSYTGLANYYVAPLQVMPQAERAASKALQLDQNLAEAHLSAGRVAFRYGWKWDVGIRHIRRSIELNPSNASAHVWNLMILLKNGQVKEAREELKRASQLDPVSLNSSHDLNWNLLDGRQYEWLIDASKKQLEIDPLFPWSHTTLGWAYARTGLLNEGIAQARQGLGDGNPIQLGMLGEVYVMAGRHQEAERVLSQLSAAAQRRYVCPHEVGALELALGEKEQAMQSVERAYAVKSDCMPFLDIDPRMDALRSHPRFQALVHRIQSN